MTEVCYICLNKMTPFQWRPKAIVNCLQCGSYQPSEEFLRDAASFEIYPQDRRHLYSGAVREVFEQAGRPVWVDDLDALVNSIVPPATPTDNIDKLLLFVARKTEYVSAGVEIETIPFSVTYARNELEMHYFVRNAKLRGYFDDSGVPASKLRLSIGGWDRVAEISAYQRESSQAFVAMSFNPVLLDVWENGFRPALSEVGYEPIRVDSKQTNDKIDDKIIADIRKSGLVVADFTEQKGGVYFEAGFALGLGIPLIWTCCDTDVDRLHFDTRQYSHIVWTNSDDLRAKLINRIEATLPNRRRVTKYNL